MPSSTEPEQIAAHSLTAIAEILIKHHNLHEGLYEVAFELQVGIGAIGPTPEHRVPGAMIGITKVGLRKVEQMQPLVVDAAKVNPASAKKSRRSS